MFKKRTRQAAKPVSHRDGRQQVCVTCLTFAHPKQRVSLVESASGASKYSVPYFEKVAALFKDAGFLYDASNLRLPSSLCSRCAREVRGDRLSSSKVSAAAAFLKELPLPSRNDTCSCQLCLLASRESRGFLRHEKPVDLLQTQ